MTPFFRQMMGGSDLESNLKMRNTADMVILLTVDTPGAIGGAKVDGIMIAITASFSNYVSFFLIMKNNRHKTKQKHFSPYESCFHLSFYDLSFLRF